MNGLGFFYVFFRIKNMINIIRKSMMLFMAALIPLRSFGLFGTADNPKIIRKGDVIPWWLEARYPPHMDMRAGVDIETFYCSDTLEQRIHPVSPLSPDSNDCLIKVSGTYETIEIIGAPTALYTEARS